MYNPFIMFDQRLLDALRETGNIYFVRQYYSRGARINDPIYKVAFLLSHYNNKEDAESHYNAIQHDPYAFFYSSLDTDHLARLKIAARMDPAYPIYSPLVTTTIWKPTELIEKHVRWYIDKRLRKWPIKSHAQVTVNLHCHHGHLILMLRFNTLSHRVSLYDIETMLSPG
jgi:hypothetical protein